MSILNPVEEILEIREETEPATRASKSSSTWLMVLFARKVNRKGFHRARWMVLYTIISRLEIYVCDMVGLVAFDIWKNWILFPILHPFFHCVKSMSLFLSLLVNDVVHVQSNNWVYARKDARSVVRVVRKLRGLSMCISTVAFYWLVKQKVLTPFSSLAVRNVSHVYRQYASVMFHFIQDKYEVKAHYFTKFCLKSGSSNCHAMLSSVHLEHNFLIQDGRNLPSFLRQLQNRWRINRIVWLLAFMILSWASAK